MGPETGPLPGTATPSLKKLESCDIECERPLSSHSLLLLFGVSHPLPQAPGLDLGLILSWLPRKPWKVLTDKQSSRLIIYMSECSQPLPPRLVLQVKREFFLIEKSLKFKRKRSDTGILLTTDTSGWVVLS